MLMVLLTIYQMPQPWRNKRSNSYPNGKLSKYLLSLSQSPIIQTLYSYRCMSFPIQHSFLHAITTKLAQITTAITSCNTNAFLFTPPPLTIQVVGRHQQLQSDLGLNLELRQPARRIGMLGLVVHILLFWVEECRLVGRWQQIELR